MWAIIIKIAVEALGWFVDNTLMRFTNPKKDVDQVNDIANKNNLNLHNGDASDVLHSKWQRPD